MAYKYPKISNYLIYKKTDMGMVEVTDYLTEESFFIGEEEAEYIKKLNGKTHPYEINTNLTKEEIDDLISEIDDYDLLRTSSVIVDGPTIMKTLWTPVWTKRLRSMAKLWNNVFLLSWLPILIIGIVLFKKNWGLMDFDLYLVGAVLGLPCGIFLHELGHAFAGAAYGANVFEMGITISFICPGAYVMVDEKPVKNKMKRVQIFAAGVESNLFLTGVFLLVASIFPRCGGIMLLAAIDNAIVAAVNLTFIKGLDGTSVISELLGINELVDTAKLISLCRDEFSGRGPSGKAAVIICWIISGIQVALPILLCINVLEVISWLI